MTMYNTLLLDQTAWDMCLDAGGNIALAKPDYAVAQDVASAIRLFKGELYYDNTKGVPYFEEILGKLPASALIQSDMETAAKTVPGVESAKTVIQNVSDGAVNGTVLFVDENGATNGVVL